ncbi:MAG: glycosyltransferase family 1 protein [Thermodesulfobacteriota bacterium]
MRLALITDAWSPQVNGVVTTLGKTVEHLRSWGHQVLTVTPDLFTTIPCPTYPDIRLALFPSGVLRHLLDDFKPQAIHIATEGPLGWTARSYCIRNRLDFTTSYHTRFPEYIRLRLPVPLSLSYRAVKKFHGAARRTMAATQDLADELRSRGFDNLRLWSRGVDTDIFQPGDKHFLRGRRPILIYVGRVAVEKNLEAFLRLEVPGTKYVVGDGPAREELEGKYPDVHFTGVKRGVELARHVAAADVFVFPSLTDTFGLVMLEAMACGVPVAAFPVTGPRQLVRNGDNGWLDADLNTAVVNALKVPDEQCRRFAMTYSWENCSRQFLDNLYVMENVRPTPGAQPSAQAIAAFEKKGYA